jgi:hypothetical protein
MGTEDLTRYLGNTEALVQILLERRIEEKNISSLIINPTAVETLAQNSPEALIAFADKSDRPSTSNI